MKLPLLAIAVIALLTVPPALLQGRYVHRWKTPATQLDAASHLSELPREFGRWRAVEDGEPLSAEVCKELGLSGNIKRTYLDADSGTTIDLLLMVGASGQLVRHPPNICYDNRANQQVGEMETISTTGLEPASSLSLLEYRRNTEAFGTRFLVAYGFSTGEGWSSPKWPRMTFGGEPMLYKMQLLTPITADDRTRAVDEQLAFLNKFVQEFSAWHRGLSSKPSPSDSGS
jgi:hypothetical protein